MAERPLVKARKPARAKLQAALGGSLEMAIAVEQMLDDVIATLPDAAYLTALAVEAAQESADEAQARADAALTKPEADLLYQPLGSGGGSVLKGQVVATVAGVLAHTETLAAVGVTPSMVIVPTLAPHGDTDENHETLLSVVALTATAGTGQITVNLAFSELTSGPIRINYLAV